MNIEIETPRDEEAIVEAVLFYDKVNAGRSARWEASQDLQVPILTGDRSASATARWPQPRPGIRSLLCELLTCEGEQPDEHEGAAQGQPADAIPP